MKDFKQLLKQNPDQLVLNSIKCPDGTILESRYRHHFVRHVQEDGREYFVDGGLDYQRIGHSDNSYENLSLTVLDDHSIIRERFKWTRVLDADMNRLPEPQIIVLKDITEDHLQALLSWTSSGYASWINYVFVKEKEYRDENT